MLSQEEYLRVQISLEREAMAWIREKENFIFEKLMVMLVTIYSFFTLMTLPTTLINSLAIWQKVLIVLALGAGFLLSVLLLAFISEYRLNNVLSGKYLSPHIGRMGCVPGYFLSLREEERFGSMKKVIAKSKLSARELEIIDCLIIDGSKLTVKELIETSKLLVK